MKRLLRGLLASAMLTTTVLSSGPGIVFAADDSGSADTEYEVIEGSETIPSGHIVVKEWTLMDGNPVNKKREGKTYELHLLPEAARPELNSEYTSDDLFLFDLPIYFNMEEGD